MLLNIIRSKEKADRGGCRVEREGDRFRRRMPLRLALIILLSSSAAGWLFPARVLAQAGVSNSPVTISSSAATGIALASAGQYQVLSDAQWKDYEDVITIATLNGVNKMAWNTGQPLTSANYSSIASLVRAQLNAGAPSAAQFQNQDEATRLRYGIDMLSSLAGSPQAGPLLPQVLFGLEKTKFTQLETALDPSRQTPADLALYAVRVSALQFIADQVQQASDLAQNDPQFALALNPVLDDLTTFDTTSSYAQIQGSYGNALPTLPSANSDGSYSLNEQNLMSQYQSRVGAAQSAVDSALANLGTNSAYVTSKIRPLDSSTPTMCSNGKAPEANSAGVCWSDLTSLVTGVSKVVGLANSTLGSDVFTVGSAMISADSAIAQLATGTLSGLATAGPVGAIIGAGVSIFSTLSGGSSSSNPNAAVLSQIKELSQQITTLQKVMIAQFAQVDSALNTIMKTLVQNFALIDYNLGVLNGNVTQMQNALLDAEAQLNQMEQYNLAYQQAEEADTLMLSVNGCLNYRATHNGQDIGNNVFDDCQNTFYTWAQANALNAIWAPPPVSYTDEEVYNYFENFSNSAVCPNGCPTPFAATVNGLNEFAPNYLGLANALSNATPLANPDEWTLGARAYLTMSYQWPQYASGLSAPLYLGPLVNTGTNLQQAAQNVNSIRPTNGPISQNPGVFSALTNNYNNAASQLQSDINNFVNNTFLKDPSLKFGQTLTLWGGPGQSNAYAPTALSASNVATCDGSSFIYQMPPSVLTLIPSIARTAEQLGIGQVSVCVQFSAPFAGTTWNRDYEAWMWYSLYTYQINIAVSGSTVIAQSAYVLAPTEDCCGDINPCQTSIWNGFSSTDPQPCGDVNGDTMSFYPIAPTPIGSGCQTLSSAVTGPNPLIVNLSTAFSQFVNQSGGLWICNGSAPLANSFTTASVQTNDPTNELNTLSSEIANIFQTDQQTLYGDIAQRLSALGDPIQADGQLLSTGKLMFQAYANFGLPNSVQNNPGLRGALYGNEALYDRSGVQADFVGFKAAPITDTTQDKIILEIAAINSRLSTLTTPINSALQNVQTNQLPESLSQIDVTLEDLQAFANLQNANALTPCSFQLSPGFALVGANGGSGTITVQELNGCSWRASTNSSWLTVTSGASGTGSGSVTYLVAADPTGATRDAILIIGDQLLHISQTATSSFVEVPGTLSQVSVGSDGSVWGTNSVGDIYTFNSQSQTWQNVPGWLSQIAVGSSGFVWGLNPAGDIYRFDPSTHNWDPIPGSLSQIAVGSDGDVWGLNGGPIFHFNTTTQNWDWIPGILRQIAVGFDGAVWGINADGKVYRFNPGSRMFQQAPGLLTQIAVGADGDVWGLNSGSVFHFNAYTQNWDAMPGSLSQIVVGSGNNVWGLDASGNTYTFNGQAQNWTAIPGTLSQIAVGGNGAVWGVDSGGQIYQFVQPTQQTQTMHQLPGQLKQIAVSPDGNVWGVNSANEIYIFNPIWQNWWQVPGSLSQIAVGFGGNVWGLDANQQIYRLDLANIALTGQNWDNIPGLLSQIAVGANGDVWGINSGGQIYRFDPSIQNWDPMPGWLAQLSVGADGAVWGLNDGGVIYRFNPGTQNWDPIQGNLSQIAVGSSANVWGINSGGLIYRFDPATQNWDPIPGWLSQISVGFDGSIWGINSGDVVYRFDSQTQNWDPIPGSLSQITVGADALVWGLDSGSNIYTFK